MSHRHSATLLLAALSAAAIGGLSHLAARAGDTPSAAQPAAPTDKRIQKEAVISASAEQVWRAWTTNEGIREFFAPGSNVNLSIGGDFEIFFAPDAPAGSRGADGCRILSYLPHEMLSFDWNFPPAVPSLRNAGAKTWVVLQFSDAGAGKTRVHLTQLGWQPGEDWEKGYTYFDNAWTNVLANLEKRFTSGPIDWKAPRTR